MMKHLWVDIHTHQQINNNQIISIFNSFTNESSEVNHRISIGIHPWKIDSDNWLTDFQKIKKASANQNVKFIGETGLDKIKGPVLEIQQKVFEAHIQLAKETNKPLIIHCVKAHNETIEILKKNNFPFPVIFHGFDKKLSIAKEIIKNGFFISFGKALFIKPEISKEVLQMVPHDKIFFETDESNYSIQEIYSQASLLSGHSIEYWKKSVFSNYQNLGNE